MENPQKPLPSIEPEEGQVIEPVLPVEIIGDMPPDWFAIKQTYLSQPDLPLYKLAKKFNVSTTAITSRIKKEDWKTQRQILQANVDIKTKTLLEDKLAEINARQAIIGKFLQKEGINVIKSKEVKIRSAKTALEFIMGGLQIERTAEGLDKQTPQVVNIIAQQQSVIDKYKK